MELKRMSFKFFQLCLVAGLFLFLPVQAKSGPGDSLLYYINPARQARLIRNPVEWEQKRLQILNGMQEAMGKLPSRSNLPDFNVQYLDSLREDGHIRYTIKFTVAENEDLTALLYLPVQTGIVKKLPAMLVLHGTDDLGKMVLSGISPKANRSYAKELAQRGYIVIAPDYPSFGDMKDYDFETDRYQSASMKAIFNHIRSVDLLQSRAEVDPGRIGVIGHSLGGHNAMFAGAFDPRLKVIVSSCGWTLFDYYNIGTEASAKYGGRLGPWAQTRYMPLIRDKYKLDADLIPFDFDEIIAALAPRPFFSNSPLNDSNFDVKGVKKGIAAALPVYQLFKAGDNLQVRYPEAAHDFPPSVRMEAYQFIDQVLKHIPTKHTLLH